MARPALMSWLRAGVEIKVDTLAYPRMWFGGAMWCPWDLFISFKACSDAKEKGVESNGKLPHLFIPSKTATLVPEFAVEDLPLSRTAALVTEFAVKNLPLGRTL